MNEQQRMATFSASYDIDRDYWSIRHDMTPRCLARLVMGIAGMDGVQDEISVMESEIADDDRVEAVDAEDAQ